MKKNYKLIEEYLDELFSDPKCELSYNSDYTLLISIMLSAQTTDKRVNEVTKVLFNKYKTLEKLKNASLDDLKKIIYPLGNFNKKAVYVKSIATILHDSYNDSVPLDESVICSLPGIGRKTCNVFLSEYYNIPRIAVDTHVLRVAKRLNLCYNNATVIDVEKTLMKNIKKDNWGKRHLQLVLFGRYYCLAKKPSCNNCKLRGICNYGIK